MINIASFDFDAKTEEAVPRDHFGEALQSGRYVWADLSGEYPAQVAEVLREAGVSEMAIAEVIGPDREGRHDIHESCLHCAVTEARLAGGKLVTTHVDFVLTHGAMITVSRQDAAFMQAMRRVYREDFAKFARSPGFLIYELADNLLDSHRRTHGEFSAANERVQARLFEGADDEIFREVAALLGDLLAFRKMVMGARELLHELAIRKSAFVSETTQPYLQNLALALERLGNDLATEREVLSETLHLYMGMVGHRTNRVVNRLTVISMLFLPLGFLCGVYGMNLRMPETEWTYGYVVFWILVVTLVGSLLYFMRRNRWI
jgi:magnesium transporter